MENLGYYHPAVVHFAIGLLAAGVLLRWASLTRRLPFAGPAALVLLVLGTAAAVTATQTGTAAHGPVERVPGAAPAVQEHEEWGKRTSNVFLVVLLVEVVALVLARWGRQEPALIVSAVIGLVGLGALLYAGHLGGRLVYSYAGGVGIRTGDAADLDRLVDRASNLPYYSVMIVADADAQRTVAELKVQAGMPAEVYIEGTKQTPLQYLVEPITSTIRRAGREI